MHINGHKNAKIYNTQRQTEYKSHRAFIYNNARYTESPKYYVKNYRNENVNNNGSKIKTMFLAPNIEPVC